DRGGDFERFGAEPRGSGEHGARRGRGDRARGRGIPTVVCGSLEFRARRERAAMNPPQWRYWFAGVLLVAVIIAALSFPGLRRQVNKAKDLTEKTAEQARRELLPPTVNTGDPKVKVQMFWGSRGQNGELAPVLVELPLSKDPVLRSKQVLNTLLAGPVDAEL